MNTKFENKPNKVGEARKKMQDSIAEERHKLVNMTNADFEKEYENHKLDSLRVICELYSIDPVQLMRILRNHLVRRLIRIWESEFEQIYNEPLYMYIDEDGDRIFARIKAIDKVDNEDETFKGTVDVFYTPKGDTDKLATEVSIRGTKIYPPKGMLIGKVTPVDNRFFVEFVESDKSIKEWSMKKEELTETDKKEVVDTDVIKSFKYPPEINIGNIYNIRFEVKQIYADRPAEYTMIEVPMDDGLTRNLPSTDDFPNDNRVKFLDIAEKYLKAKGWIPNDDNITLTRYEIVDATPKDEVTYIEKEVVDGGTVTHKPLNMERYGLKEGESLDGLYTHFNIDEDDMDIDTLIEYLTTQYKYMHSEKCKKRCEKLIKQMKMVKIISEIMKLKDDEVK